MPLQLCHLVRMTRDTWQAVLCTTCQPSFDGSLDRQEMRTYKEAEEAGRIAGFELVESVDIATVSPVNGPW